MKTFEFKSQICTTKEQSKRLLALGLKKETADMFYSRLSRGYQWGLSIGLPLGYDVLSDDYLIPAWSLHRLIFLIPEEINIDGFKFPLMSDAIRRLEDADYMYERLIGIIERVIEQGYFNKDYLEEK